MGSDFRGAGLKIWGAGGRSEGGECEELGREFLERKK